MLFRPEHFLLSLVVYERRTTLKLSIHYSVVSPMPSGFCRRFQSKSFMFKLVVRVTALAATICWPVKAVGAKKASAWQKEVRPIRSNDESPRREPKTKDDRQTHSCQSGKNEDVGWFMRDHITGRRAVINSVRGSRAGGYSGDFNCYR